VENRLPEAVWDIGRECARFVNEVHMSSKCSREGSLSPAFPCYRYSLYWFSCSSVRTKRITTISSYSYCQPYNRTWQRTGGVYSLATRNTACRNSIGPSRFGGYRRAVKNGSVYG
jgi:hypothetical protein